MDPALLATLPLIADGNPAAALRRAAGVAAGAGAGLGPQGHPVEALNLLQPEAVQAVHAAYAAAGARLLRTNTAGANGMLLTASGLDGRAEAINNSGSALARAGAGPAGLVMGTLEAPPQAGLLEEPGWRRAIGEQIVYLSDTAVDFFLLQHVTRLADAVTLTRTLHQLSDAPVLAALMLDAGGHTADGFAAGEAGAALVDAGADALGLSCAPAPTALQAGLDGLSQCGLPLAVLGGLHVQSRTQPLDAQAFADWLAPLAAQGVAILGGCCGCEPEHIRALARALGRS